MNQVLGAKVAYFNPTQANFFGAAKNRTSIQGKSPRFIEQLKQGLPRDMQAKIDRAHQTGKPIDGRVRNQIHSHMERLGPSQGRGQNTNLNTQNGRRQWIGTEGQGYAHRGRFTGDRANSGGLRAQIAQDGGTVPSRRSGMSGSSSVGGVSGRRTGGNPMQLRDMELMHSRRERRKLKRMRKARGAERAAEMSAANNRAASTQDAVQNYQQERIRRRAEGKQLKAERKQLRARGRKRLRRAKVQATPIQAAPAQATPVAETGMTVRRPSRSAPSMSGREFNAQSRGRKPLQLPSPAQANSAAETGMVVRKSNRAAPSMSGMEFNARSRGQNLRQLPSPAQSNTGMSVSRSSGGNPPPRGRTAPLMLDGPPRSKPLMLEGPGARPALGGPGAGGGTSSPTGRRVIRRRTSRPTVRPNGARTRVRPTATPQLRGPSTPMSLPAPTVSNATSSASNTASSAARRAGGKASGGMGRFGKLGLGAAALAALYGAKKYNDSRNENRAV